MDVRRSKAESLLGSFIASVSSTSLAHSLNRALRHRMRHGGREFLGIAVQQAQQRLALLALGENGIGAGGLG